MSGTGLPSVRSSAVACCSRCGGSCSERGVNQLERVAMMKGGDLSGQGPTREVPQEMNKGTKEEERVEGRQGS